MISVSEALNFLRDHVSQITQTEIVPLVAATGRVIAQDQIAEIDVPPADNSAMDGFALRFTDLQEQTSLPISQRIPAGYKPSPLAPGTAARIFTGAEIPEGADTVVIQENCDYDDKAVTVNALDDIGPGKNIRPRGQDVRSGDVLIKSGCLLRAMEVGVLASIGVARIKVFRKLKVAVVSTGDELVEPGQRLQKGQIYNSNQYLLMGLLQSMGLDAVNAGCAEDNPAQIEALLRRAAELADCVISIGGVSVGEEDHVKPVLQLLGKLDFWKIAIKPGKPLAFGEICGKPFFGLPGNPVSSFVTFTVLVTPYLRAMQGQRFQPIQPRCVVAGFSVSRPGSRQVYLRAVVEQRNGQETAILLANQGSGVLTSASEADVLAIIPAGEVIAEGDTIHAIDLGKQIVF